MIKEWSLISDDLIVKIINLGASITSIQYRHGDKRDVVLGYDSIEEYQTYENYFGATIGRCANRIKNASFEIDGQMYTLNANDHENALHGGTLGFHGRIFKVSIVNQELVFHYISEDGEEGYPGNLNFKVIYRLEKNKLYIRYEAHCDKDTIVNFTNHSYFALQGEGEGSVEEQIMTTPCSLYAENDPQRLVNGKFSRVEHTPFDFRHGKQIGNDIQSECIQIQNANGYDHYFRFDSNKKKTICVKDLKTNHTLQVTTDMPGFHFYVPNYQEECIGKGGKVYKGHCACCIETSFLPDAIHLQKQPETLLKANDIFVSETVYQFS